jgi:hypothetical protein
MVESVTTKARLFFLFWKAEERVPFENKMRTRIFFAFGFCFGDEQKSLLSSSLCFFLFSRAAEEDAFGFFFISL